MRVYLEGIGILGPGLLGWQQTRTVLHNEAAWEPAPPPKPMPAIFSPNERRRCSGTVRWAVHVAEEALAHSGMTAHDVATVFTCSDGDGAILHQLCESLTQPEPMLSPTCFHQSVHNAPAGYFSIAHGSLRPSTSLACYDGSFSAGLIEAAAQTQIEGTPILLVSYDVPAPPPLCAIRPLPGPMAVAFVTAREASRHSLAEMSIEYAHGFEGELTSMSNAGLETLRREIPSGRALPLLAAVARADPCTLHLEYVSTGALRITVEPIAAANDRDSG